jgi:sporulation protein YlmC with PRC-barrel domain
MNTKNIDILSTKRSSIEDSQGSNFFLGKKILAHSGYQIGTVKDLVITGNTLLGILTKMKKRVFIDMEYVAGASDDAIMLSIDPIFDIIGKQVFDAEGKRIGKVISLERKNNANNFTALIVKKNIIRKAVSIPKGDIQTVKDNILLKTVFQEK